MSAIWHDYQTPTFLAPPPQFSFQDIAEIVAPAPEAYTAAHIRLQRWERKMGAVWYQSNAELAYKFYLAKRPWWLA